MANFISKDQVINEFISNWTSGGSNGKDYWLNPWSYEQSMFVIYRMVRYLSMLANVESLGNICSSEINLNPGKGYEFISGALLGSFSSEAHEYITLKKAPYFAGSYGDDLHVDFSKHAVISQPWKRGFGNNVPEYSMLMAIEDPKHDFCNHSNYCPEDIMKFDLILPWGVMIASSNGNHRAMACVLSGTGRFSKEHISSVWDFGRLLDEVNFQTIDSYATILGKSLYDIGIIMLENSRKYGIKNCDFTWLLKY